MFLAVSFFKHYLICTLSICSAVQHHGIDELSVFKYSDHRTVIQSQVIAYMRFDSHSGVSYLFQFFFGKRIKNRELSVLKMCFDLIVFGSGYNYLCGIHKSDYYVHAQGYHKEQRAQPEEVRSYLPWKSFP